MAFDITTYLPVLASIPNVNQYFWALIVFLGILVLLHVFKYIILNRVRALAERTKTDVDDFVVVVIESIGWPFYFVFALYIPMRMLSLPDIAMNAIFYVTFIVATYYVVISLQHIIKFVLGKYVKTQKRKDPNGDFEIIKFLGKLINVALWAIAIVLVLANVGYDVSTLVAGLGVGGIAIAFALQNILSDIFASFSIYFDKPFKIGDFVVIGNDSGTVEKIGIKSTRIRTLQGEQLIASNKELTETRIHNFGKMKERRVVFNLGFTYDTPTTKLRKIPKLLKDTISKVKKVRFDRAHFHKFGDFSLNYEVVYYLDTADYVAFMNAQQQINLALKAAFDKEKIDMAFPTQTVYLEK